VYHYAPQSLESRVEWFRDKSSGGYPVIIAEEAGRVAGFATYGPFRPWPAYKYTVEHSVYVHKEHRGKGIGKRLLQEIVRLAAERGYATLVGGIDASNDDSIALHRKLGFAHAGTIRRAGYKFGRWLDLDFYELQLPGPAQPVES
jgi:phosphinothricin acetyltransferase